MKLACALSVTIVASAACGASSDTAGSSPAYGDAGTSQPPSGYASDAGSWAGAASDAGAASPGTNVSLGGASDFGYFRRLLAEGRVPASSDIEASGFFAEHHTPLPPPTCGERICLQAMLGAMEGLAGAPRTTVLQLGLNSPVTIDPSQRPPLNLALVIDVSGSMAAAGKIDFVRLGLSQMVGALQDDDQVALITYSNEAAVQMGMARVGPVRDRLRTLVSGLAAGGGTNLWGGLERGYQEVRRAYDSGRQNRVLLLSDGQPTAGVTDFEQILSLSRAQNSDGVGLTTIGLGTDFNHRLMRDLALQGDGNFYFVEDATAVREVFTEELAYFTLPVAFDLRLELSAGTDFTFRRAHGSPLFRTTREGGVLEVPSVFLAHRVAHDDVSGPGQERRGGGSALLVELAARDDDGTSPATAQVAVVHVSFREPGTDRRVTREVTVNYPHAPWRVPLEGHFSDPIVEKSFVMLQIYLAIADAADLFHAGRGTDALGLLTRVVAAVRDFEDSANGGTGDLDMRLDVELLEDLQRVMRAQGAVDPADAQVPADPWPAD